MRTSDRLHSPKGPRKRTGVRDADPIACRSVSNVELMRDGFRKRSISEAEEHRVQRIAEALRIASSENGFSHDHAAMALKGERT